MLSVSCRYHQMIYSNIMTLLFFLFQLTYTYNGDLLLKKEGKSKKIRRSIKETYLETEESYLLSKEKIDNTFNGHSTDYYLIWYRTLPFYQYYSSYEYLKEFLERHANSPVSKDRARIDLATSTVFTTFIILFTVLLLSISTPVFTIFLQWLVRRKCFKLREENSKENYPVNKRSTKTENCHPTSIFVQYPKDLIEKE